MILSRRRLVTGTAFWLLGARPSFAALTGAAASAPTATIKAFYDTLLEVMKKAKQQNIRQRYAELKPAILKAFDLAFMTRIAVGPKWSSFSLAERQKLVAAFRRYTVASYARNFDSYSGERFEVSPEPAKSPGGVIVESRLVPAGGKAITLNYLMRRNGGRWQIADVYLKGTISQLAVRRSEFADVLSRSGAEGLVRLLDRKAAALAAG